MTETNKTVKPEQRPNGEQTPAAQAGEEQDNQARDGTENTS